MFPFCTSYAVLFHHDEIGTPYALPSYDFTDYIYYFSQRTLKKVKRILIAQWISRHVIYSVNKSSV